MNQYPYPISYINELLLKNKKRQIFEVKRFQDLYFCLKIQQTEDFQSLAPVLLKIETLGWEIYPHRNKIYIIPPFLQKGAAVKYMQEQLQTSVLWAAGDSKMDYSFLIASSQSFVPRHGELANQLDESVPLKITKSSGIKAAEEILSAIYNQLSKVPQ